jgi:hypothetical protein
MWSRVHMYTGDRCRRAQDSQHQSPSAHHGGGGRGHGRRHADPHCQLPGLQALDPAVSHLPGVWPHRRPRHHHQVQEHHDTSHLLILLSLVMVYRRIPMEPTLLRLAS